MTFREDTNLAMAPLAQSLSRRACFPDQGRSGHQGVPPARHGGWGAHATRCSLRYNSRDLRVATVYTNAPKWHREAVLANLCTLLRSHGCPQRPNSVHKCPNPARRGRFSQSVYTPAFPQGRSRDRAGPLVPRRRRPHGPVMPERSDLRSTLPER